MTVRPTALAAVYVTPSNLKVIASPAANPEPVNAMVVLPSVPEVGDTAIEAAVTLKLDAAVLTGIPLFRSDKDIVCVPAK